MLDVAGPQYCGASVSANGCESAPSSTDLDKFEYYFRQMVQSDPGLQELIWRDGSREDESCDDPLSKLVLRGEDVVKRFDINAFRYAEGTEGTAEVVDRDGEEREVSVGRGLYYCVTGSAGSSAESEKNLNPVYSADRDKIRNALIRITEGSEDHFRSAADLTVALRSACSNAVRVQCFAGTESWVGGGFIPQVENGDERVLVTACHVIEGARREAQGKPLRCYAKSNNPGASPIAKLEIPSFDSSWCDKGKDIAVLKTATDSKTSLESLASPYKVVTMSPREINERIENGNATLVQMTWTSKSLIEDPFSIEAPDAVEVAGSSGGSSEDSSSGSGQVALGLSLGGSNGVGGQIEPDLVPPTDPRRRAYSANYGQTSEYIYGSLGQSTGASGNPLLLCTAEEGCVAVALMKSRYRGNRGIPDDQLYSGPYAPNEVLGSVNHWVPAQYILEMLR